MCDHIESARRHGEFEFFIEERSPDRVRSRMPVQPGILNPMGLVQAGAMVRLADVTATIMALQTVELGPKGEGFPLAIDLHTSLPGNQREGEIWAEARPVKTGRRVTVIRTRVTGEGGRLPAELTSTHVAAS